MEVSDSTTRKVLRKRDLMIKRPSALGFDTINNDSIEQIRNCTRETRILDEHEREEKLNVFRKYMSLLEPLFIARSKIIETIPRFWATVIEYHPKLAYLITEETSEILKYLKEVEVDNIETKHFKITLVFEENPYIENTVLVKEFSSCSGNEFVSVTTPIKWQRNPNQDKSKLETDVGLKRKRENNTFITWFCDDDREDQNSIMSCFEEMWQNPLPFFIWGIMDSEEEDFDNVGYCDIDVDTNEGDNVFENEDSGSEAMNEEDCWREEDEAEEEDDYDNSEFEEEDEAAREEDMDDDNDEEV